MYVLALIAILIVASLVTRIVNSKPIEPSHDTKRGDEEIKAFLREW